MLRPFPLLALLFGCAPEDTPVHPDLPQDTAAEEEELVTDCEEAGFQQILDAHEDPAALRAALSAATALGTCHYSTTTNFLFLELDNDDGVVTCVYTGRTTEAIDEKPDHVTDMNTEHLWPQSLGASEVPARCDLHHLRTCDSHANQVRANHPFGWVDGAPTWEEGGSRLGQDVNGATVFEPRAGERGAISRSMLYFAVRYDHALPSPQEALFRDWHLDEPATDWEIARSFAIADRQGYANPFVVCPEAVERVFP